MKQFVSAMLMVAVIFPATGGISSGSWSQPAATAQLYLLVPLTKERDNIFAAGAEAARFVEALHQEVHKTREAISANRSVKVEGLESSVMVRQADDRNVELFLNYSLPITTDK